MPKSRTKYVCQQCGHESPGYYGRCPDCGTWGSMVETVEQPAQSSAAGRRSVSAGAGGTQAMRLADVPSDGGQRIPVAIDEFSRVLGGGMVPGSLVLVGGDPGIGKSTLLLQVSTLHSSMQGSVLYVSAEESPQQIKLRAERLNVVPDDLLVLGETDMSQILTHIETVNPSLVVIDSIQTVFLPSLVERWCVIHQCGPAAANGDYPRLLQARAALPESRRDRYVVRERVGSELADIYAAADLVIGRSGGGTVAELSLLGKPSILIPLPGTSSDEQTRNAKVLADAGGAILLPQVELSNQRLLFHIDSVLSDPDQRASMSLSASSVAQPDAADLLADEILTLAGVGSS